MSLKFLRPDLWWLFLLFVLAFATVIRLSYASVEAPLKEKRFLLVLRIIVTAILLLVLLQPVLDSITQRSVKPGLAVLVDSSLSMSVADPKGKGSFLSITVNAVIDNIVKKWHNDYESGAYEFSDRIRPVRDIRNIKPEAGKTDLSQSLLNFFNYFTENEYKGVLIVSDGQFAVDSELADVVKKYRDNGIAIMPVMRANAETVKDVAVRFSADNQAELFTDQEVQILVDIKNTATTAHVKLNLYDNDILIRTKEMSAAPGLQSAAFSYRPSKEGVHKLKVEIVGAGEDQFKENNVDHFFVKVDKGGYNVALIYGEMSWEFKFLREMLESDPTISLTAIPRIKDDSFEVLDKMNLGLFDLVILGNVGKKDLKDSFFGEIARRVKSAGLSLLILGGERSFMSESGLNPEFAAVLPFGTGKMAPVTDPTAVTLTKEGESASVVLLADDPVMNRKAWEGLPLLNYISVVEPKKDSSVYLASAKNKNVSVLGYRMSGLGKVYYFAGYPTWKWAFMNLAVNDDSRKYYTFYKQLLRDMTSSRLEKMNLNTDKFLYRPGETARISAVLLDDNYRPPAFNSVEVNITKNGKSWRNITLRNSTIMRERFSMELPLEDDGEYKMTMTALGKKLESAFVVRRSAEEFFSIGPDPVSMTRLASLGGTAVVDPDKPLDITKFVETKKTMKKFSSRKPLWNWFPVVIIIVVLLTTEWIIRKRRGLL